MKNYLVFIPIFAAFVVAAILVEMASFLFIATLIWVVIHL